MTAAPAPSATPALLAMTSPTPNAARPTFRTISRVAEPCPSVRREPDGQPAYLVDDADRLHGLPGPGRDLADLPGDLTDGLGGGHRETPSRLVGKGCHPGTKNHRAPSAFSERAEPAQLRGDILRLEFYAL